jgi:Spy/CpxP family protein refolding chaperone
MKRTLIATLMICSIVPATLAFAHWMPGGHDSRGPQGALWASLSPEQKEQMRELRRKFLDEAASVLGSFLAKRIELRALWSDPKADPSAIETKERQAADLLRQIREKALKYRLQARSLLTPDQISRFQGGQWLFRAPGMGGGCGPGMEERGGPGWGGPGQWRHPND